jgi:hypothetical protein
MESEQIQPQQSANTAAPAGRSLAARLALGFAGFIVLLIIAVFIASFFFDGMIRPRLEAAMNRNLKGYHVSPGHAHLQLIGLRLTLSRLLIMQEAHPTPPVANFPTMRFHIYWQELMTGHLLGTVGIWYPKIHIDRAQLATEARSKTPLRERGWQDALQSVYPFKINRLSIYNGEVTYLDGAGPRPLHLARLTFATDNICNIHELNNIYPSRFSGQMTVFDRGRLRVEGRANYLMKPFPGVMADYWLKDAPLSSVTPASRHVNMTIKGGTLSREGRIEYSPKITNVDVTNATINSVDLIICICARPSKPKRSVSPQPAERLKRRTIAPPSTSSCVNWIFETAASLSTTVLPIRPTCCSLRTPIST